MSARFAHRGVVSSSVVVGAITAALIIWPRPVDVVLETIASRTADCVLAGPQGNADLAQLISHRATQECRGGRGAVALSEVTPYRWDRVVVLPSRTGATSTLGRVGMYWPILTCTRRHVEPGWTQLAFVEDGKVVDFLDIPAQGVLDLPDKPHSVPRQAASLPVQCPAEQLARR